MAKNVIQFTPKDVQTTLERWKGQCKEDNDTREWIDCVIIHNLLSPLFGFSNLHPCVVPHRSEDERSIAFYKEFFVEDIVARAYAHNLHSLGTDYTKSCYNMISEVTRTKELEYTADWSELKKRDLKALSEDYHQSLELIAEYLPMSPVMKKLTPLTVKQEEHCTWADIAGETIIYIGNGFFSPNFQRQEFNLEEDVNTFLMNARDTYKKNGVSMPYCKVHEMTACADYTKNAIEPLVWNALEHAFNPENDITGRINSEDYHKGIAIFGYPEKEIDISTENLHGYKKPADSGNYIVRVEDNGFGIREEHLSGLFEKGYSTKKDKDTSHGIGLWSVKQFVEKHGGTVYVKTELGKGTSFHFTIPYSHLSDHRCIQAKP